MDSDRILQGRVIGIFGIFMIFIYAALGLLLLLTSFWQDLSMRTELGVVLLIWAAFRAFMLFRMRARMKNSTPDEQH